MTAPLSPMKYIFRMQVFLQILGVLDECTTFQWNVVLIWAINNPDYLCFSNKYAYNIEKIN